MRRKGIRSSSRRWSRLLRDSPDGEVAVPATIQALLAARLDQLDPVERDVLGRGSVEGRVFHRGAVQALSPDGAQLVAPLTALVRRELLRPDGPQFPGRGRLSLPPPADPRRGLRGAPESDSGGPARALRRLDRRTRRRSRRAGRGRRLPPRAGVSLPGRARPCGRGGAGAFRACRRAPGGCGSEGGCPRRRAGGDRSPRPRCLPATRRRCAPAAPPASPREGVARGRAMGARGRGSLGGRRATRAPQATAGWPPTAPSR